MDTFRERTSVALNRLLKVAKSDLKSASAFKRNAQPANDESTELIREIRKAYEEWMWIQQQFEDAVEPELIDQVIYTLQTAEKRYSYLLRMARRQGITVTL